MRQSSTNQNLRQLKYINKNFIVKYANNLFLKTIQEMIRRISFQSILDAGCGEGVSLLQASLVAKDSLFMGFDLDKRRVDLAKSSMSIAHFFVANAHDIPVPDQSFDLVISLETLEHVGEPSCAIKEIARITKHYALLSVPHEPWWRLANLLRGKYWKKLGNPPGHINHWTSKGFHALVETEFRILQTRQPFLWTFVLAEKTID